MGPESIRGGDEGQSEDDLFARASAGDQGAWRALFHECYPKVRRVVRKKLKDGPLRRHIDSTDVANDVLADLALNASRHRFESIDQVRAFLIHAAHQRVVDEHRRQLRRKRDGTRDRPMSVGDSDAWGSSSGEPTPSQVAVANEVDSKLLSEAEDDTCRRVLELRRDQHDNAEIAVQTGWSLQKVQRYLKKKRDAFLN